MSIVAAFCWDGSRNKSISYMIIDDKYRVRHDPVIKRLNPKDLDSLKREADNVINTFFTEIEKLSQANKGSNITIEYKIVGHAAPVNQYHVEIQKPSDRTEFVKNKFVELYIRHINSVIFGLKFEHL